MIRPIKGELLPFSFGIYSSKRNDTGPSGQTVAVWCCMSAIDKECFPHEFRYWLWRSIFVPLILKTQKLMLRGRKPNLLSLFFVCVLMYMFDIYWTIQLQQQFTCSLRFSFRWGQTSTRASLFDHQTFRFVIIKRKTLPSYRRNAAAASPMRSKGNTSIKSLLYNSSRKNNSTFSVALFILHLLFWLEEILWGQAHLTITRCVFMDNSLRWICLWRNRSR